MHGYAEKVQNNILKRSQRATSRAVIKARLTIYDVTSRKWKAHPCISPDFPPKKGKKKNRAKKMSVRNFFHLVWIPPLSSVARCCERGREPHCAPRGHSYCYWANHAICFFIPLVVHRRWAPESSLARKESQSKLYIVLNACLRNPHRTPGFLSACPHPDGKPDFKERKKKKKKSCAFFCLFRFAFSSCRVFKGPV